MGDDNIKKATVGQRFEATTRRRGPMGMEKVKVPHTVAAKCDTNNGHWYCITHDEGFSNQFEKDSHIHDNSINHVLAWNCNVHGPEVP